jgi:WD40 repeat protein
MGNCSSSRRKIPIPHKQGISTAIRNVVIEDISEGKQLRRSYSKGNVINNTNININNFNLTNNEKENIDKNKIVKSKSKSKEKNINDFDIKKYYSFNGNINRDNDSNNSKVKNILIKPRISSTVNLNKNSKCKIKNKIPRPSFNFNNNYNISNISNISENNPIRSQKIKTKKYDINAYTYNNQINKENINILNNSNYNSINNENKNRFVYKCIKTIEGHKEKIVSMIELSNNLIATGSYDSKIKIWNLESLQCIRTISEEGNIFCLLEMEPNIILSGTNKNTIQLFNLNYNDNEIYQFSFIGHDLWVNCLIKCSEYYFASGSNDTEIKIWDYKNRTIYRTLRGHQDCILSMILLKNKKICSGSADLSLRIWDWGIGICEFFFSGHEKWIKCLCQLDKDDVIISGADDMKIKVWKNVGHRNNINNWKIIKEYTGHKHSVRTLCKINEDTFASGSFDGSIKIWNLNKDEAIQSLEGHKSYVISVIKIKNGDLVSCSNDHTIKIWRNEI